MGGVGSGVTVDIDIGLGFVQSLGQKSVMVREFVCTESVNSRERKKKT